MRMSSLKYFYEVSELKSISKVSNDLHISQPALSHQLSKLEKDLDVKIFERSNRGVELTDKGKILYNYASEILSLYDSLLEELNENDESKQEIKISILSRYGNFLIDKVAKDIGRIFKGINVNISNQSEVNDKSLLLHNRADVVIGCNKIDDTDLISEYIGSDQIFLVSTKHVHCSEIKNLSVSLLDDNLSSVLSTLEKLNKINICLKSDSLDVIKSYLKSTNTAAIVPNIAVQKELQSGELSRLCSDEYVVEYDLFVTYRKDIETNLKKKLKIFKKDLQTVLNKERVKGSIKEN